MSTQLKQSLGISNFLPCLNLKSHPQEGQVRKTTCKNRKKPTKPHPAPLNVGTLTAITTESSLGTASVFWIGKLCISIPMVK